MLLNKKLFLFTVGIGLGASLSGWSYPGGITGYSGKPSSNTCTACHSTGYAAPVTITGPTSVVAGSTNKYTFTFGNSAGRNGGFNVALDSATSGILSSASSDVQALNGELTQTGAKAADSSGNVSFTFNWTAPGNAGKITLYGAGAASYGGGGTGNSSLGVTVTSAVAPSQPPTANAGGPYAGNTGTAISLDGSKSAASSGSTLSTYSWTFGDGATGNGAKVTHSYSTAGTYQATLKVIDNNNLSATATAQVSVTSVVVIPPPVVYQPPVAHAGGPYAGNTGALISLDGSNSVAATGSTLVSYEWDFADGTKAMGAKVSHAFPAPGTFLVNLIVTDNRGLTSTAQATVVVTNVLVTPPVVTPPVATPPPTGKHHKKRHHSSSDDGGGSDSTSGSGSSQQDD